MIGSDSGIKWSSVRRKRIIVWRNKGRDRRNARYQDIRCATITRTKRRADIIFSFVMFLCRLNGSYRLMLPGIACILARHKDQGQHVKGEEPGDYLFCVSHQVKSSKKCYSLALLRDCFFKMNTSKIMILSREINNYPVKPDSAYRIIIVNNSSNR